MPRTVASALWIAIIFSCVVFAAPLAYAVTLQQDSETLTNADIIKMVQAHLSTDVIVNQIQAQPGNYLLNSSNLIKLKQAGVPDKAIEAMQAKSHGSAPAASSGSAGSTHAAGGAASLSTGREYTVDEFSRNLHGILSKTAVAHGLDAHDYDKEEAYIRRTLETCVLDMTNLKSVRPNPADPEFEICQRNTAAHLTVDGMKDISVAAGNGHNPNSHMALGRGDLLMSTGGTGRWWPGEKYAVTLKVFMDWGPTGGGRLLPEFRFADVLSDIAIKGHPPTAAAASAATPAPSQPGAVPFSATQGAPGASATAAATARQTGAPFNLGVLDGANLPNPNMIGLMNFLRLTPHAIEDDEVLAEFMRQNNRVGQDRELLAQHLANEFDRPQVVAYYRSNASAIVAQAPSVISAGSSATLGDYDLSRHAFPIMRGNQQGWSSGNAVEIGSFSALAANSPIAPSYRGGRVRLEVDFQLFTLDWVPVSEAVARQVIGASRGRNINITTKIQILQQPPQLELQNGGSPHFHFAGKVLSVDVVGPTNEVLATIDMSGSSASAPASSGPSAAQGGAAAVSAEQPVPGASGAPAGAASTGSAALPIPVVHDGVTGKVLSQFLEKCSAGDSKGCEMVGYDLEKGWGADKDLQAAKAYYAKACSMGRKGDCGR